MKELVSVIIPIYKTEKFIEKCIISLCNQTLDNFEIILVDDCSPDNAMEKALDILRMYPNRFNLSKTIRLKKNVGAAKARRLAFDIAEGNYITCLDSDDYLEHNALEMMLNKAIESQSDLVICDYYISFPEWEYVVTQETGKNSYLKDLLLNKLHGAFWNKLYKKELLDKAIILDHVNMLEDLLCSIQCAIYNPNITYLKMPFVHYIQYNTNSYTYNYSSKSIQDILIVMDFIHKKLDEHGILQKYKAEISYRKLFSKFMILCNSSGKERERFFDLYENEKDGYKYLSLYHKTILWAAKLRMSKLIDTILFFKNKIKVVIGWYKARL